jgi:hypothetical protein
MLRTAIKVVGVLGALTLLLAVSVSWVVVRVVPADGPTIVVPAPLLLAQAVVDWSPVGREPIRLDPAFASYREPALATLRELRTSGDAELVRVESARETVAIMKRGDQLAVEVLQQDETVRVNLTLAAVERLLRDWDGEVLRPAQIVAALGDFDTGKALEFHTREAAVDIWVW